MKYTRGKAGPTSSMAIKIAMVSQMDVGSPNSRARGYGTATMAHGKQKSVTFLAQGKHHRALAPQLAKGSIIDVDVRWTARDEVTVIGVRTPQAQAA